MKFYDPNCGSIRDRDKQICVYFAFLGAVLPAFLALTNNTYCTQLITI